MGQSDEISSGVFYDPGTRSPIRIACSAIQILDKEGDWLMFPFFVDVGTCPVFYRSDQFGTKGLQNSTGERL